jgi:nitrite reductase/ring-hydroxylating ferredoxin subunit
MEHVTVDVAALVDVPVGCGLAAVVEGRPIALFWVDDEIVAYQGTCLHRGGPLAEGACRDGVVTCPSHWWRYDLRTGTRVDDPTLRLHRYPVAIRDGRVLVTVPRAGEPEGWRERLLRLARERAEAEETGL